MKQSTLILGLLLSFSSLFGQNLNFETFYIKTLRYPLKPLPKEVKTYSIEFDKGKLKETNGILGLVNKYLQLDGYTKMDSGADVTIYLKFNRFIVEEKKLITQTSTNKVDGKDVKVNTYFYEIPWSLSFHFKFINNHTGNALEEINGNIRQSFDFPVLPQSSKALLQKQYAAKGADELRDREKNAIKLSFQQVYDSISNKFGYKWVGETVGIGYPKNKKGKYDDLEQAMNIMKAVIQTADSKEHYLTDEFKIQINQAVEIWKKALTEFSSDKKARINQNVTDLINYNLAYANFWLQDYEQCAQYLTLLEAPKKYNVKLKALNLEGMMKDKKQRLLANNL